MSVIARRIVSTPERTTSETWEFISSLVCQDDAAAAKEFKAISGLAGACISEETIRNDPFVVVGKGSRLRVYGLFGDDAINGDRRSEDNLSWKPTESSWKAYLPCTEEDFDWMKKSLPAKSSHFIAYNLADGLPEDLKESSDGEQQRTSSDLKMNVGRFNEL